MLIFPAQAVDNCQDMCAQHKNIKHQKKLSLKRLETKTQLTS